MSQEESEHNEVDGMKKGADSTGEVMHITKRLKGLSALSYDDRLKLLNLERLEIRRLRFALLCCYKIIFGLMRIDREAFFELRTSCTRGHPYKLLLASLSGQTSLLKES